MVLVHPPVHPGGDLRLGKGRVENPDLVHQAVEVVYALDPAQPEVIGGCPHGGCFRRSGVLLAVEIDGQV